MRIKKNILILFGGTSSEHDISVLSVKNIIKNIDREEYNVHIVGITKRGRWIYINREDAIDTGEWIYGNKNAYLLPDAEKRSLIIVPDDFDSKVNTVLIDVCFPVLHGQRGEDGCIQGLLKYADIPFVGCGVLSSAAAMDKIFTKLVVDNIGIRQAKYLSFFANDQDNLDLIVDKVKKELSYPVFVKPSNSGSSVGITKAKNDEELLKGLEVAYKEDSRVLVEETINGREIECAVISSGVPKALGIGEVIASNEFYDFDAKYINEVSKTIVDPQLPDGKKEEIMDKAVRIFKALDGFSLSRVDFFLEDETNEVVFNEINTMPGFTNISMYSMIANNAGISIRELIKELIDSAYKRK